MNKQLTYMCDKLFYIHMEYDQYNCKLNDTKWTSEPI